jgi:hypothetical protein
MVARLFALEARELLRRVEEAGTAVRPFFTSRDGDARVCANAQMGRSGDG